MPAFQPGSTEPESLSLSLILQRMLRYWWLVGVLTIAGGLAGLLALSIHPPVYEAVARISASIDYVSTGPLTQYEEDTAFNAVTDVLSSNAVLQSVVERAATEDIPISLAEFRTSIVLERRVNAWDLRVRSTDANNAARLANFWVDEGSAALSKAYQHALMADHWNHYLLALENCLADSAASEPSTPQCSQSRFGEIQSDLSQAGKAYYQERMASQSLFSGLTPGPANHTSEAPRLVLYNRNQGVLAGCVIGFLLGIWLAQVGIPARWLRRS